MAHKRAACRKTIMVMVFISPVHCIFSATWRFREKQRIFCDHYRRKKNKSLRENKRMNSFVKKSYFIDFEIYRMLIDIRKRRTRKWRRSGGLWFSSFISIDLFRLTNQQNIPFTALTVYWHWKMFLLSSLSIESPVFSSCTRHNKSKKVIWTESSLSRSQKNHFHNKINVIATQ